MSFFLLFAMGLDFSFKKLINVGITAIVATVTIVCGMMFIGYTAGNAMGVLPHEQYFSGWNVVHVVHGHRIQGLQ